MADNTFTLTVAQVAYQLGVTERTVQRYQAYDENPLPVLSRGNGTASRYDSREVLAWAIRQATGAKLDYETERARLTKEQADNMAYKNAQLNRELAPIHLLEWVIAETGVQIGAILDAIPQKIKRRVPHLTASEIEIIKREIVKTQNIAASCTIDYDRYEGLT